MHSWRRPGPDPMHQQTVQTLTDPRQIQALAQPLRVDVLEALREPDSAAGVARAIGKTRQSVNYHLNALKQVGLIRHTGERRRGNFMEQLYQSVARRFVISPDFGWDADRLAATLADQISLSQLAGLGARLEQDAQALLDRAAFDGEQIASLAIEADLRFEDDQARRAFMQDYVETLKALLTKHGAARGAPFRVVMAAYPQPEEEQGEER
jgi:DNA-binding transcriptional ArsR family regulator